MELHPEYIRDMYNHYMILKGSTENKSNYTAKMLMNNSMPGILQTELRYLDSLDLYYYDITAKRTLKSMYEGKSIDYITSKKLITEVLQIIESCQEYLLEEHDFIITPEFIFLDNNHELGLCYMPGFSNNILGQLSCFFEYIMNKIDYKDELAVRLIYALYKESKDVECTFYKLYEVINQPYMKLVNEKKDPVKKDAVKEDTKEDRPTALPLTKQRLLVSRNNSIIKSENQSNSLVNFFFSRIKSDLYCIHKETNRQVKSSLGNHNKSTVVTPKNNKNTPENYHIKGEIDKNEVINDKEVFYYGLLSYVMAGSSIMLGLIILISVYLSGIVSNTLGNGVDSIKMFVCFLMVICVEIYIMTKIFDPNKKLTKMESVLEYIEADKAMKEDMSENNYKAENSVKGWRENSDITGKNLSNLQNLEETNRECKEDKTQILWSNNSGEDEETQVLIHFNKSKYNYLTPIKAKGSTAEKSKKVKVSEYPFYIGKSTDFSNMVIEDKSISRRHGVLTCMEGSIRYTDLDSTNGTFINGNKLEGGQAYTLSPFDEISFASIKYIWEEFEEE